MQWKTLMLLTSMSALAKSLALGKIPGQLNLAKIGMPLVAIKGFLHAQHMTSTQ